MALNPANGVEGPRTVAVIDEAWCIGCTLCIEACPTDAILGGNKLMHTVIEPLLHRLRAVPAGLPGRLHRDGERDRQPHRLGGLVAGRRPTRRGSATKRVAERLAQDEAGGPQLTGPRLRNLATQGRDGEADRKKSVIEAALARARSRRKAVNLPGPP